MMRASTHMRLQGAGRRALRTPQWQLPGAALASWSGAGAAWPRGLATASDAAPQQRKLVKRKVALVTGYMGTGYHGVQLNENVRTIEDELRTAIFQAGAMRESNFEDLGKIDWSRSSRTDKGVHAGCIVFSGKLLIDEENEMDPDTGRVASLTEALNARLPPTIRVFSSTRVNKRFGARKNCVLREYEYFLPLSFLQQSAVRVDDALDSDAAVDEFCRALRRFEGIHDFHNFTKSRSYFYKEHAKKMEWRAQGQAVETQDQVKNEAENETSEGDDSDEPSEAEESEQLAAGSQFLDGEQLSRKLLPRHRRSIYSCSGSLVHDFCGEPYIRVHIVGQAFLLNQIRCMVGAALAVATKGMTRTAFDAALNTSRIIRVPIAPAEGLVLLSSSFGGKLHTVSLYEDPNTSLAKERKTLVHRVLLNRHEDEEMRKFREEVIYKEVAKNWNMPDEMQRWRDYLERVYETNERLDDDELAKLLQDANQAKQELKNKRESFVQQNRAEIMEGRGQGALLPKQFTTKLCVRYGVAPGIFTSDLRRAVAKHLKTGRIPMEASEEDVLAYIDEVGPENLAKQGRKLRLSIRS